MVRCGFLSAAVPYCFQCVCPIAGISCSLMRRYLDYCFLLLSLYVCLGCGFLWCCLGCGLQMFSVVWAVALLQQLLLFLGSCFGCVRVFVVCCRFCLGCGFLLIFVLWSWLWFSSVRSSLCVCVFFIVVALTMFIFVLLVRAPLCCLYCLSSLLWFCLGCALLRFSATLSRRWFFWSCCDVVSPVDFCGVVLAALSSFL